MTIHQATTQAEAAEHALRQAQDAADVAEATLRAAGDVRECRSCMVSEDGGTALLCPTHDRARRAYRNAVRRRDAAALHAMFARAREHRARRVA